jgi:hypothetical protein
MFGEDDHLNRSASTGRLKQVVVGVALPVFIVAIAVMGIVTGTVPIYGKGGGGSITGAGAVIIAFSYLAGAAYLHFRYYWGWNERLEPHSHALQRISLTLFMVGFVAGMVCAFMNV